MRLLRVQECLAIATETGDSWGIVKARQFQAILSMEDGDYGRAELLAYEALAIFEAIGDD